ncbi:unnamed protein product, partial [Urochloa humidicola]
LRCPFLPYSIHDADLPPRLKPFRTSVANPSPSLPEIGDGRRHAVQVGQDVGGRRRHAAEAVEDRSESGRPDPDVEEADVAEGPQRQRRRTRFCRRRNRRRDRGRSMAFSVKEVCRVALGVWRPEKETPAAAAEEADELEFVERELGVGAGAS